MKELSVEEKARYYDRAIAKVKEEAIDGYLDAVAVNDIFPELAESKDEKIRKDIIGYLALYKDAIGEEYESWIAWLEKQGELVNSLSKGLDNAHERIDELIQKNNSLMRQLEKKQSKQKPADKQLTPEQASILDKHIDKFLEQKPYASETMNEKEDFDNGFTRMMKKEQKPAEWSSEQKHTLQTDNVPYESSTDAHLWTRAIGFDEEPMESKSCEQNPAWSEEDDSHIYSITEKLKGKFEKSIVITKFSLEEDLSWLNSLKNRVQPKQEWSYNDEIIIETIIQEIEKIPSEKFIDNAKYRCLDWLRYRTRSLRPQLQWKPSNEQMKGLECTIKTLKYQLNAGDNRLNSLYNDLKKLREK